MSRSNTHGIEEPSGPQPLPSVIASLQRERAERIRAEEALLELMAGTAVTGEQFFPALVRHLAKALRVRYAMLAELVDGGRKCRTLAFWADDGWQPAYEYASAGTPCEMAARQGIFYCAERVQEFFPDDVDLVRLGAESYMGVRLDSESEGALGHICVLDDKPLLDEQRSRSILTIFASRAAAELKRQRAENALRASEAALRASEERFRQLAEHAHVGIWQISPEGYTIYINAAMCRILELSNPQEIEGRTYHSFFTEESIRRIKPEHQKRRQGMPSSYEVEIIGSRGSRRSIIIFGAPVRGPDGRLLSLIGTFADITQRKQAEQHQALLVQELDHRVKNNLAAVMSVAEQTLAGSATLEEFGRVFNGRLKAMSIAHEMLAGTSWEGAEMRQMLARVCEPYRRGRGDPFTLSGPSLVLSAKVAPSLCMVMHELVANAAKYGALSVPEGRVLISWHVALQETEPELCVRWQEVDGPPVAPPTRRGFGSELIEQMIAYQLHGATRLMFEQAGVVCEMTVPLEFDEPEHRASDARSERESVPDA